MNKFDHNFDVIFEFNVSNKFFNMDFEEEIANSP